MANKITVNIIAQSLGISRNTVSKVLNGHYVPEKTREQVLLKARELNYKSMGNEDEKKNYKILLISGKPLNSIPYYIPVIKRIENICFEKQIDLYQYTLDPRKNVIDTLSNAIKSFNIDGIICIEILDNDTVSKILKMKKSACFIDFPVWYQGSNYDNYDVIVPSSDTIYFVIKKCLEAKKVKQVSFVGDVNHCLSFNRRYLTMLDALYTNNFHHNREHDVLLNDRVDLGDITVLKNTIEQNANETNLFVCANDYIANKTILALKIMKKKIPEEVMVIGFDDIEENKNERPLLTTIDVDKEYIGQKAVDTLVERIKRNNSPTSTIYISSKLVLKESLKL